VKVWDNGPSRANQVLRGHNDWVQALAFGAVDPEHAVLASGAKDGRVLLWNPDTGASLGELPRHAGAVTAVAFARHRFGLLAVGTWDEKGAGEIKLWELVREDKASTLKSKEVRTLKDHSSGITCLAFGPRGPRLASGSADKTAIIWDPETGKIVHKLEGHQGEVRCLTWIPDGSLLVTAGADKMLRVWAADNGALAYGPIVTNTDTIEGVNFQIRRTAAFQIPMFITAGRDQLLRIHTVEGKVGFIPLGATHAADHPITTLLHMPSQLLASGGWDGTVRIWDIEHQPEKEGVGRFTFRERFVFTGHSGPVRALAMTGDESILASGGHDGTIRLWRATPTQRPALPLPKERAKVAK
jgi:WD40 repeat protein